MRRRYVSDSSGRVPLEHTQFVDVWVEDLVHEPNTWRLEWVLVRKLDMDLPHSTRKRCYGGRGGAASMRQWCQLTERITAEG